MVRCEDSASSSSGTGNDGKDTVMDAVATLYGAAEVVRNSKDLVEAAFDGDMGEIQAWIDKGFHIESTDGRKHSGLSEGVTHLRLTLNRTWILALTLTLTLICTLHSSSM